MNLEKKIERAHKRLMAAEDEFNELWTMWLRSLRCRPLSITNQLKGVSGRRVDTKNDSFNKRPTGAGSELAPDLKGVGT